MIVMTVIFTDESDKSLDIDCEKIARDVGEKALDLLACPYEASVSLTLTTDEDIRAVNRDFRQIDRATDVLSFPMIPFDTPAGYEILEEDDSFFDMDSGELLLGDILISVDHVLQQAEEYGHSVTREFAFLVAHSMLHLLGFDHMTPEEAEVMEQKQEEVLSALGINR